MQTSIAIYSVYITATAVPCPGISAKAASSTSSKSCNAQSAWYTVRRFELSSRSASIGERMKRQMLPAAIIPPSSAFEQPRA